MRGLKPIVEKSLDYCYNTECKKEDRLPRIQAFIEVQTPSVNKVIWVALMEVFLGDVLSLHLTALLGFNDISSVTTGPVVPLRGVPDDSAEDALGFLTREAYLDYSRALLRRLHSGGGVDLALESYVQDMIRFNWLTLDELMHVNNMHALNMGYPDKELEVIIAAMRRAGEMYRRKPRLVMWQEIT